MSADPKVIAGWMNDLSVMVGARPDDADLRVRITAATAMLAQRAEPGWFTADSLEFCMRKFKFFPSYAELWARLQTFDREKSKQLALTSPPELPYEGSGLSTGDRSWCKGWQDRREGNRAERGVFLSCIRKFAPEGFKLLVRDDEIARDIAAKRGWLREPRTETDPVPPSQDIRGKITNGAAMPIASGAPRSPDPAHQRLIADQVQERAGRPLGALSPEALEEARRRANSPLAGRTANGVPVAKPAPAEEPPPAPPPTPEEQPFKFAWC
jgi:hypothetical protein